MILQYNGIASSVNKKLDCFLNGKVAFLLRVEVKCNAISPTDAKAIVIPVLLLKVVNVKSRKKDV